MFLAMGVPVIASRQPSFQFIEDYECGVLVDDEAGFIAAIDQMRHRLDEMKANALRCAREYIDAPGKYLVLRDAIAELLGSSLGKDSS
jgi:glycosyltransferase involved in cell wall biosynthesis